MKSRKRIAIRFLKDYKAHQACGNEKREMITVTMTKVEIDVPEEIVPYTVLEDKESQTIRNAMLVYPYIKKGVMSHGKAAEMLGLHKIDLITLYGKLGLPYFDESCEEFREDLAVLKELRGTGV